MLEGSNLQQACKSVKSIGTDKAKQKAKVQTSEYGCSSRTPASAAAAAVSVLKVKQTHW
jgi:hypothetical protein